MSKRMTTNLLAVLFVVVVLAAMLLLGGCTKYVVDKEVQPDGTSTTHVSATSTRDLEQPELHYERKGADAKFDFSAAGVDNNTDAFMGMVSGMMGMMMQMMDGMMMKMMSMQPPVPDQR